MQKLPPIPVPKGIRYISDWDKLEEGKRIRNYLPIDEPYIMNKTITGCGFTEYWITNDQDVIICSPRKALLENKRDQHQDMLNLLYLEDEYATFQPYDKDLSKPDKSSKDKNEVDSEKAKKYNEYLNSKIRQHTDTCTIKQVPCKFLVTYDSFRRIKEALGVRINSFTVVVDEFQAIFTDSRFKSDTENVFLYNLQDLKRVCYLSATPMLEKYLDKLDEFKNLKYLTLDWNEEEPGRVIKPYLKVKHCPRGIVSEVKRVVNSYLSGEYEKLAIIDNSGNLNEVYSKEAVIYVNSIKNICDIIRKCKLTTENTNILCANTPENNKKIKQAFKVSMEDESFPIPENCIGKIPREGEPHKMFTLCTRTVYLGADFYSTNARSFIFSDANVDCLSVDISLDLPQILGRQRLDENPWKNRAEFYFILNTAKISQEEFDSILNKKIEITDNLLSGYEKMDLKEKHAFAVAYQEVAKTLNYKNNFIAVNEHAGSDLKPVFNKLMMVSEMRAFEIQQVDYADRLSVFNAIEGFNKDTELVDINIDVETIYSLQYLPEKFKYLCSLNQEVALQCLPHLPEIFTNYYTVLGPEKIRALGYKTSDMKKEYEGRIGNTKINIKEKIISMFVIGDKYKKTTVKSMLDELYNSINYHKTPKASDILEFFEVNDCRIQNIETGKRDAGYLIVSIKS